jgi:hypothetical protein
MKQPRDWFFNSGEENEMKECGEGVDCENIIQSGVKRVCI